MESKELKQKIVDILVEKNISQTQAHYLFFEQILEHTAVEILCSGSNITDPPVLPMKRIFSFLA